MDRFPMKVSLCDEMGKGIGYLHCKCAGVFDRVGHYFGVIEKGSNVHDVDVKGAIKRHFNNRLVDCPYSLIDIDGDRVVFKVAFL